MRRITLEKVMDCRGVHLIAAKKGQPFHTGDIIEINTPDGTYHVIFNRPATLVVCDGCLFEDSVKWGLWSCPVFKDGSLLCSHTKDKGTQFIPLDRVLEDL